MPTIYSFREMAWKNIMGQNDGQSKCLIPLAMPMACGHIKINAGPDGSQVATHVRFQNCVILSGLSSDSASVFPDQKNDRSNMIVLAQLINI